MNQSLFLLPKPIELFGIIFVDDGVSRFIASIPLIIVSIPVILIVAFVLYRLMRRKAPVAAYAAPAQGLDYPRSFYHFDPGPPRGFEPEIEDVQLLKNAQLPISASMPLAFSTAQPLLVDELPIVDELTMPVKIPSLTNDADAYLRYISGGEHLPVQLPIKTNESVRFGRQPSFCEHVLDDLRISRLHAKIVHFDTYFYIFDEGSTGGTFVNGRRLNVTDKHRLQDGDIINLNEVAYQFELACKASSSSILCWPLCHQPV